MKTSAVKKIEYCYISQNYRDDEEVVGNANDDEVGRWRSENNVAILFNQ